jgi:hypothetical protein
LRFVRIEDSLSPSFNRTRACERIPRLRCDERCLFSFVAFALLRRVLHDYRQHTRLVSKTDTWRNIDYGGNGRRRILWTAFHSIFDTGNCQLPLTAGRVHSAYNKRIFGIQEYRSANGTMTLSIPWTHISVLATKSEYATLIVRLKGDCF